jgi:hypothetical protein
VDVSGALWMAALTACLLSHCCERRSLVRSAFGRSRRGRFMLRHGVSARCCACACCCAWGGCGVRGFCVVIRLWHSVVALAALYCDLAE